MWGYTYVKPKDAIVLCMISVCCAAMHHIYFIDVIVSCMIP